MYYIRYGFFYFGIEISVVKDSVLLSKLTIVFLLKATSNPQFGCILHSFSLTKVLSFHYKDCNLISHNSIKIRFGKILACISSRKASEQQ